MNPDEKEEYEKFRQGGMVGGKNVPGKRVRKKISDANQQLAKLTRETIPSLIVLYDNTPLGFHTDPNNIRFGMYGQATVIFSIPSDRGKSPHITDWKFGPNRKMTKTENTSTSAIAVMLREIDNLDHPPYLVIYHNVFAKVPLRPDLLGRIGLRQFTLEDAIEGKYQEWSELYP